MLFWEALLFTFGLFFFLNLSLQLQKSAGIETTM